jgi:hypothetical protein
LGGCHAGEGSGKTASLVYLICAAKNNFAVIRDASEFEEPRARPLDHSESPRDEGDPPRKEDVLCYPVRMDAFIQALAQNDLIDVGSLALVPKRPGLYAWFFKEAPPGVPMQDCLFRNEMPLLYIGIAPKGPWMNSSIQKKSTQSLRHRIQYHYRGNAEGSTLRLTLGCLLAFQLGL